MPLIVMKFGGTSMAGIERIRGVAARVKREVDAGNQVAVVVSAMAGETDRLVGFCREASPLADPAEYDVVVAAGEQVTSGLLAIVLQSVGLKARSWLGWQLPVSTSEGHSKARIKDVGTEALHAALASGEVAVIPGFQGMASDGRITTLGRGGSDTSAVAVAAALKANRCDITPTWKASLPRIPASCLGRESWQKSPMRKCWSWRLLAQRCCKPDRLSWP